MTSEMTLHIGLQITTTPTSLDPQSGGRPSRFREKTPCRIRHIRRQPARSVQSTGAQQ